MDESQCLPSFVTKTSPWHIYHYVGWKVAKAGNSVHVERAGDSIVLSQELVTSAFARFTSTDAKKWVLATIRVSRTVDGVLISPQCVDASYMETFREMASACERLFANRTRELHSSIDPAMAHSLLAGRGERWRWDRGDTWGEHRWLVSLNSSPLELMQYMFEVSRRHGMLTARTRHGVVMLSQSLSRIDGEMWERLERGWVEAPDEQIGNPFEFMAGTAEALFSFEILGEYDEGVMVEAVCSNSETFGMAFNDLVFRCTSHFGEDADEGDEFMLIGEVPPDRDSLHYAFPLDRRKTVVAEYWRLRANGERVTKTEFARRLGINPKTLNSYINEFPELAPDSAPNVSC